MRQDNHTGSYELRDMSVAGHLPMRDLSHGAVDRVGERCCFI